MKRNKLSNLLMIITLSVFANGCDDLDYKPINQIDNETIGGSAELLSNLTMGTYSRLREREYMRNRHVSQEYPSDDIVLCKTTGDHLLYSYNYQHLVNSGISLNFWRQAYYGIYSANTVIEKIPDDASESLLQLKGENLFLRALMHFDLLRMFSRPFNQSPETNLGVVIKSTTEEPTPPSRSTVKETYDFIVGDLLRAAELMHVDKSAIFASKEAAWALLARVYLYMENYTEAEIYADKVIESGKYELLPTDQYRVYFTFLPENNRETIFAIKLREVENMGKTSIGSMYHGVGGWGEIFASKPFRDLIYKNENDARIHFIDPEYTLDGNGNRIPDPNEHAGYKVNIRDNQPKYFINKYTNEGGVQMLSSPVVIRLAELYLIKAEVCAKGGRGEEALQLVNIIRERAGLTGSQLFAMDHLQGYATVLDIVLDERRLELAWEGHRAFDCFRNGRGVDRSYVPAFAWAGPKRIILPEENSIVHLIPEEEITLNPNLIQNPL